MNIYIVQGGIGKHVLFSSMIDKLYEINNEKIIIVSAYPDLFKFHPKVEVSADFHQPGFYDEFIKDTNNNIIYQEPYYSNYVHGKTHILEEWCHLLNIEYDINLLPDIYVDDFAIDECNRFTDNNPNFIVTQFSGGQSPLNIDPNRPHINMGQIRDYPRQLAQELVNEIKEKNPVLTILNYALPNEQTYNLENTISIEAPYLFYVVLLQYAKTYISIDSSLQHFAANKYNEKKGVVLWGETSPTCLGYTKNINISKGKNSMRPLCNILGDIFNKDGSPWIHEDPKCMEIEKDKIISAMEECIDFNDKLPNKVLTNISEESNLIPLNDKTRDMLISIQMQIKQLDDKFKTVVESYVAANDREGSYAISNDGKKLIRLR